mgnify:CR=1 FL=1
MHVLFVAQNDFLGDNNNGGIAITRRNYGVLKNVLGETNIDVAMISLDNTSKGFQSNPNAIWIEGNIRGFRNVINEVFNHTYITAKGEKQLFSALVKNKYDVVWLDSTHYGTIAKKIKERITTKIVSYAYDFESEYMKMYCMPSLRHPQYYLKMHRVRQNERNALLYSDRFICISDRDRESYLRTYGKEVDLVYPVTLEDRFDKNIVENGKKMRDYFLFVGSYFKPNIEGIMWFALNVATKIDADIYVVGKGMENIDSQKFPPNIKVKGGVEDLGEYYVNAIGVIMPIFSGSGMKVKTAEAMMYGKPILGTDEALRGYAVDSLEGIYRCNTKEEFLNAIGTVLKKSNYYYQDIRDYYDSFCNTANMQEKIRELIYGL